jgi:hypothetical protein
VYKWSINRVINQSPVYSLTHARKLVSEVVGLDTALDLDR